MEINRDTLKPVSLQPFPGASEFGGTSGAAGGVFEWRGTCYKVTGTTLYSVNSSGTFTSIGTIAGSGQCSFASTYSEMVICRSGNVYSYNGTTLTAATDADFETPNYVASLNQQAIYDGDQNRFCVSNAGDLTVINGLNFATIETLPGILIRPYVFNEIIYFFCDKYSVQWYNSGVGNPPVDKITNASVLKGLKEGHCVHHNKAYMYWLGDDCVVYRTIAGQPEVVSTIPVSTEFCSYNTTGATLRCFQLHGQEFVILYFPVEQRTWVFNEAGGWFELTYTNQEAGIPYTGYIEIYGKKLMEYGGFLYELDDDLFRIGSDYMIKERSSDTITAEGLFGPQYAGLYVEYDKVTITAKIVSLLATETYLILGYSDDNGENWTYVNLSAGQLLGRNTWTFEIYDMGSAIERIWRVRVSDNVRCAIYGGSMEVNVSV